jgi:hypothetical protein
MLDAYIPEGALSPEAEDKLLARPAGLLDLLARRPPQPPSRH